MPFIEIHLIEGYSAEAKRRLSLAVTNAVRLVVPAAPEAITILTHEAPTENYMRGGEQKSPAPALKDPIAIVGDFLGAMERRDIARAQDHLADDFSMVFPGGAQMTSLAALIEWAKKRYRSVSKTIETFDLASTETGTVVYCFGTLAGEWLDGTHFEGIRFIDRFEFTGNRISRQYVWNDLAEKRGPIS